MSNHAGRIRVKAMLLALNEDRTTHAVSVNMPSDENPEGFHRLIGGGVEFGETHEATIRREIDEELSATIHDLEYVGALENFFSMSGELGHEIVFVYTGRLDPAPAAEGATLTESDGSIVPVVWRPVDDAGEALPLYPAGVDSLLRQHLGITA